MTKHKAMKIYTDSLIKWKSRLNDLGFDNGISERRLCADDMDAFLLDIAALLAIKDLEQEGMTVAADEVRRMLRL